MEVDVEKLKELREDNVLSMRELAERAQVGYNTIYRIENAKGTARPVTIRKLAAALGVEPRTLVKKDRL